MKTITVKVTTDDGKDNSNTSVIVEKDRGAGYIRMDSRDIVTNKDKAQEFKLRQGERLVIEAYPPEAVAYDRDQFVAYKTENQEDPNKVDSPKRMETSEEKQKNQQERARLDKVEPGARPSTPPRTTLENPAPEPIAGTVAFGEKNAAASKQIQPPGVSPAAAGQPKNPTSAPTPTSSPASTSKKDDPNPGLISSKDK